MNRKLMTVLTMTAFVSGIGYAMGDAAIGAGSTKETAQVKNVGNKICPVSGEAIQEKEAGTIEYEGKTYNLCCAMCAKDFKKDPKKYVQKVEAMQKKEQEQTKEDAHQHHHDIP